MKVTNITILFLFLLSGVMYAQESTYRNPVIQGDYPDPTVIRVGDTYYAAGTSSEWALPYRLYESKDLVNWQYTGPLFNEIPEWTMGSYWAPELYYHNNTYYVYYTARRKNDKKSFIGVATTKDINKGFTDHGLIIEWTNEAIDAFVIEIGGKLYITWKAYGLDQGKDIEILGAELTADGLKLKGEAFTMLRANTKDWEGGGIEGQCLIQHGGYIYMFYAGNACCGANCNYMTGIARAKSMEGPWERYQGNPVLYGDDHWRCPGHGTIVTTPGQRYFFLYHAYNATSNIFTGRQGLMEEIMWDKTTGWPYFRYGTTPSQQAQAPFEKTVQQAVSDFTDDFNSPLRDREWMWDVSQKPQYSISEGKLTLSGDGSAVTFMGLRPRKENYTLKAGVTLSGTSSPGLCIYGTKEQIMGISISKNEVELWQLKDGKYSTLAKETLNGSGNTQLFIETSFGQYCRFGYMVNDKMHVVGGLQHITGLPQWDRPPMPGIVVKDKNRAVFTEVKLQYR